jgi:phosphopantothenoylcysteine decarboxylase/phosphopantothenate--cysteine ligase
MEQVIMEEFPRCHIFLSAAAVSDYRPREKVCGKLCSGQTLLLELVPNTDILAKLGEKKEDRMLVGFCVEEKNLVHEAKRKMESKNLDMIVANKPESMGGEKAAAIIIKRDGSIQHLPTMSKLKVAEAIWEEVLSMLQSR